MMIYPPIADLVKKAGSRYSLVIETAKRARQLSQGAPAFSESDSQKEVSIAANEIYEGKLSAVLPSQIEQHRDKLAENAQSADDADIFGNGEYEEDENGEVTDKLDESLDDTEADYEASEDLEDLEDLDDLDDLDDSEE